MKYFILVFLFVMSSAFGATCTTTSRTNYTTGQKLTSSALNADLNQLVTKVNSLDGGCVTDGTIEASAFDSSLDALKNGILQGCELSYVDANNISIGKCLLSVAGNFVKTTATTNVTWGCTGCTAEANNTQYYVYAKSTSSGSTLSYLISTTAPGADGFDLSGNKILGKFYNGAPGAAGNIFPSSIYSWASNKFIRSIDGSSIGAMDSFTFFYGDGFGTVCNKGSGVACAYLSQSGSFVTSVTGTIAAGNYVINLARSYKVINCTGNIFTAFGAPSTPGFITRIMSATDSSTVTFGTSSSASPGVEVNSFGMITCQGY